MNRKFGTFRKNGFGMGGGGHGGAVSTHASLNLTPMIDLLTVVLVFLIKSYSVEPAFLTPTQNIALATTTSEQIAPDKAVLIVGKDGVLIEGKLIVAFNKNGVVDAKMLSAQGEILELRKALDAIAQKTKFIAERNSSVKFTGTLILQADRELPFDSLKPILRTAGLAGFSDIKFAGVYPE